MRLAHPNPCSLVFDRVATFFSAATGLPFFLHELEILRHFVAIYRPRLALLKNLRHSKLLLNVAGQNSTKVNRIELLQHYHDGRFSSSSVPNDDERGLMRIELMHCEQSATLLSPKHEQVVHAKLL